MRQGFDIDRDGLNTPAFLAMLPEVDGLSGLDIGCGEGANTRDLARRGARMTGIDISDVFLRFAQDTGLGREDSVPQEAMDRPLDVSYQLASAVELPFRSGVFDFATAFMSLMDIPESDHAVREAYRVLRPGGFFQFSILHPCFATTRWKWVTDESGERIGVVCGDYFTRPQGRIEEWIFARHPRR